MIFITIILFFFIYILFNYCELDCQPYYDAFKYFPELNNILQNYDAIKKEIIDYNNGETETNNYWRDWKEYNLINKNIGKWQIIPILINNKWLIDKKNNTFPILINTLKGVFNSGNLKHVAISKMSPKTRLTPHCGWASYSNYHLRCHLPIYLPQIHSIADYSYVSVKNIVKIHKYGEFILFDDSCEHFAENGSDDEERIVLIMDFIRPETIPLGKSTVADTPEYLEFIRSWAG